MSIPNLPDILGAALHGALADTQAWLARQAQGDGTEGGSFGNPGQRLAQEGQALLDGHTRLPLVGDVHYGALPGVASVPLRVPAALDDAAGMTGELLDKLLVKPVSGAVVGGVAGSQQAGYYALHPDQQPSADDQAYIDAWDALIHGHAGRANDIVAAQHPILQGGMNLAVGFAPGAEAALPEELAASAPRLAALVEALNAASRASVKPFEVAPVLHPIQSTGIGTLLHGLTATDDASRVAGDWQISRTTPQILPHLDRIAPANGDLLGNWVGRATDPLMTGGPRANIQPLGTGPNQIPTPQAQLIAQILKGNDARPAINAVAARPPAPTPVRSGVAALSGTTPDVGNWIARATDNALRDAPLGNGPSQIPTPDNPLTALALDQLQHLPPKPIADPTIRPGQLPLKADPAALPDLPTLPETGAQRQISPNVDNSPAPLSGLANSPLDALRQLLLSGDGGRDMIYPPSDKAFYAKRLGIDPEQVPGLLAQLEQDGTLGRDHTGALIVKTPDTGGIPPEAISAADEAQAAHFAYPEPTPTTPTPMPDFPAYSGQDRASILRALPPQQIDTLLSVAYGAPEAITNAYAKYNDPAALVDAALTRIQTSRNKVTLLSATDPELAQAVAFLPDAAEQGAPAAPAAVAASLNAPQPAIYNDPSGPFIRVGTAGTTPTWGAGYKDAVATEARTMLNIRDRAIKEGMPIPRQLGGGIGFAGAPADAVPRYSLAEQGAFNGPTVEGNRANWKIHLNVYDWPLANSIADWLDGNGIGYKLGNAENVNKGLTIYAGSRDNYQRLASALDQKFGAVLPPMEGTPKGDERVVGNIWGRFDTHSAPDFLAYGQDGRPLLKAAPNDPNAGHAAAARLFGEHYTGATAAPTLPTAPEDRAAWQRNYVGQSQAGTDILAPTGQVGGSDLTQTAMNAMSPADRLAMLKRLALNPDQGIVPPIFNSPPAIALGNAVGGGVGALGNIGKAYAASVKDAGRHFADVQAGPDTGFLPGKQNGFLRASSALRVEHKTFAGVQARNLLNNAFNASAAGGVSPVTYLRNANDMAGRLPQYLTAIRAAEQLPAGPAQDAALAQAHLNVLPADWQAIRQRYGDTAVSGILAKLGEDFQRQDQASADVKMIPGALRGATTSLLGPAQLIGLPAVALGAVRGAALPFRSRLQTNLNLPIDQAGRLSVAMRGLQEALAGGATIDQAGDAAGAAAIRAFGDFTNHGGAGEWANAVIPGYQWTGAQGRVIGNILQDHPELLPAAAIAAQHGLYPQVNRAEPGKTATVEINDRTPGVGLVARAMNGGAAGTANINPLFPFSPVAGDVLNLADEMTHPERHPMVSPLQNALEALDSAGVAINPAIAIALEKAGIISGAPSDPNRLTKLGQAGDIAFNDWLDAHTQAGDKNRLIGAFPTLAGLFAPDGATSGGYDPQAIMAGRVQNPVVDKAANEIVFEQTHKPLMDPSNRDYVAQTFDPNSPLMKQAKARAGQQLVAQALSSNFGPTPTTATTDTAQQAAVAKEALVAAGLTDDQIKQMEIASGNPLVDIQGGMLSAIAEAGLPAARIYADATPKERGELLLQFYHHEHNSYAFANPGGEQYQEGVEQQRLGLKPAGSLIQPARSYALGALGLTPGGGGTIPASLAALLYAGQSGGAPPISIPGLLAPTPSSPYQLPPGAGRP